MIASVVFIALLLSAIALPVGTRALRANVVTA